MSTDYAEKERNFVEALGSDTGRDLHDWLRVIAESGLTDRNEIIDWLRLQGFAFAKASWLERIHNNGGRLIYADQTGAPIQGSPEVVAKPTDRKASGTAKPAQSASPPVKAPATDREDTRPVSVDGEIGALLGAAKGLRPLAEHILRAIHDVVPHARLHALGPLVMISAPEPIAALLPGPKKIKLYAAFGPTGNGLVRPADLVNKGPPPFSEMLELDDVRRIDDIFRRLVCELLPPEPLQRRA